MIKLQGSVSVKSNFALADDAPREFESRLAANQCRAAIDMAVGYIIRPEGSGIRNIAIRQEVSVRIL
jgi:hypothetical protein